MPPDWRGGGGGADDGAWDWGIWRYLGFSACSPSTMSEHDRARHGAQWSHGAVGEGLGSIQKRILAEVKTEGRVAVLARALDLEAGEGRRRRALCVLEHQPARASNGRAERAIDGARERGV